MATVIATFADETSLSPYSGKNYIESDKASLVRVSVVHDGEEVLSLPMTEAYPGTRFFTRKRSAQVEPFPPVTYLFIGWAEGPVYLISEAGVVSARRHPSKTESLYGPPDFLDGEITY